MSKTPEDYIKLVEHLYITLDKLKNVFIYKTAYKDVTTCLVKPFKNDKELDTLYLLRKDNKLPIMTIEKLENFRFKIDDYAENGEDILLSRVVSKSQDLNDLAEELKKWLNDYLKNKGE